MSQKKIAFVGNPNTGKTTLFNLLSGLNQKVGNYPGVTVEKKIGRLQGQNTTYTLYDLPGIYSIYPNSLDEESALADLSDSTSKDFPDLLVMVSEPSNIQRSIQLAFQLKRFKIPMIFCINKSDEMAEMKLTIDQMGLEQLLEMPVILTNARKDEGMDELKRLFALDIPIKNKVYFSVPEEFKPAVKEVAEFLQTDEYNAWVYLAQSGKSPDKNPQKINEIIQKYQLIPGRLKVKESIIRNETLKPKIEELLHYGKTQSETLTRKLDRILLHPVLGYVIFFGVLLFIFELMFTWTSPMVDGIDQGMSFFASWLAESLPEGPINLFLSQGLIPGIAGVLVFVPQIAFLFLCIGILEESGYMSRVVFLMDKLMKPFGLNGKSVVPLISGMACAIPAVMSARNIENEKERLATILITPFMTCSARLPIYVIIIGLVIPDQKILIFHSQSLVLFGLYLIGVIAALLMAMILKYVIKSNFRSYLLVEMPNYRLPHYKNLLLTLWQKVYGFVWEAGKIILAMSIILWVLGSFGQGKAYEEQKQILEQVNLPNDIKDNELAALKLEHSYLGKVGKMIEPVISPLGYDWKMGIGLLSSFAAREVFVGTMSVLYGLGDTDEEQSIIQRMKKEQNSLTGKPSYNLASGISLLLFYAFALQCMSTVAIIKKETGGWKWAVIQFFVMSGLAYVLAFVAYQVLK